MKNNNVSLLSTTPDFWTLLAAIRDYEYIGYTILTVFIPRDFSGSEDQIKKYMVQKQGSEFKVEVKRPVRIVDIDTDSTIDL